MFDEREEGSISRKISLKSFLLLPDKDFRIAACLEHKLFFDHLILSHYFNFDTKIYFDLILCSIKLLFKIKNTQNI